MLEEENRPFFFQPYSFMSRQRIQLSPSYPRATISRPIACPTRFARAEQADRIDLVACSRGESTLSIACARARQHDDMSRCRQSYRSARVAEDATFFDLLMCWASRGHGNDGEKVTHQVTIT